MAEINIEPGVHPTHEDEQQKVFDATEQGDANSHAWNSAVRRRISTYRPSVIAVDSACPVINTEEIDFAYKAALWTLMPGKPSELNDTEEILLVAGDNVYGGPDPNTLTRTLIRSSVLYGSTYAGAKIAMATYDRLKSDPRKLGSSEAEVYDWEKVEASEAEQDATKTKQMTRRTMLGIMGGAFALATGLSSRFAAESPFGFATDTMAEVDTRYSKIDPDHAIDLDGSYDYVDGRTALLIAKLQETLSLKGVKDPAALVVGDAHLSKASLLLGDAKAREEYIRRHSELVINDAKKDINFFAEPSNTDQRAQRALEKQTRTQVYRVREPSETAFRANPQKEIDRVITLVEEWDSFSVTSATKGILGPQDK